MSGGDVAVLAELDPRTGHDMVRRQLAQLYPLNQLGEDALERLMPALRVVLYPANTLLYAAGESPPDNFYVLEGCVCLYDRDWSPQLKISPQPDDETPPLPSLVPTDERALAVENSVVLQVDRALLEQCMPTGSVPARPTPAPAADAAAMTPATRSPAPVRADRVLLVTHEQIEASACRALVKSIGLRSDWVSSAEEAIELLRIEHYGTVLLDLQLPDGDAFDVVKCVREREPRPRIIALTDAGDDRKGCLAAGVDDVIFKPLTDDAVRTRLS